jgi:hypothetical protein
MRSHELPPASRPASPSGLVAPDGLMRDIRVGLPLIRVVSGSACPSGLLLSACQQSGNGSVPRDKRGLLASLAVMNTGPRL